MLSRARVLMESENARKFLTTHFPMNEGTLSTNSKYTEYNSNRSSGLFQNKLRMRETQAEKFVL